jgi:hypothetical protein
MAHKKSSMLRSRVSLRYYVWDDTALWRLPHRLHAAVVSGEAKLLRFANTRCKIIEVLVSRQLSQPIIKMVRGVVYAFDAEGRLDLSDVGDAIEMVIQGSRPRRLQENVIDVSPVLRDRRWSSTHAWQPTVEMVHQINADLTAKNIPTLKA